MEKSKITYVFLLASVAAVALSIGRGDFFTENGLAYLTWNLFLAWIPYLISVYWLKKETSIRRFFSIFIVWLLFFPNAPYLITDIIHVASPYVHVLRYDSLVFFTFAMVGFFLGVVSLLHMYKYLRVYLKKIWQRELTIFGICLLASFGMYLGRFERWNSWDFFMRPTELVRHSYAISTTFGHASQPLVFIGVFTLFMYASYKIALIFLEPIQVST